MKRKEINKYIIFIRNQKIFETWQEQRNFFTLRDLAKVFNLSPSQIFRIIKDKIKGRQK